MPALCSYGWEYQEVFAHSNTLLLNREKINKQKTLGACQIYGYIDIHADVKCLEVLLLPYA